MKSIPVFTFFIIGICTILFYSCKKDTASSSNPTIPTISTTALSTVTAITAQTGGTITSDGGSPVTARGVCWRKDYSNPTITDTKTTDGTGGGTFTSTLTNLQSHSSYYIRAYATNAVGTAYGNEVIALTENGVPSLRTDSVTTDYNLWKSGGTVRNSGGGTITEKGTCWSTHSNPTIADEKSVGLYITDIIFYNYLRLATNATYYVRAYATNEYGTGYGNEVTCTTGIAVGLYHQGGVIFLVDGTGQHGLIAAVSNQSNGVQWGLVGVTTNATSVSNGSSNTTNIINTLGPGTYAANLCRNYTGGGYTDWFLPSLNQINYMNIAGSIPDYPGMINVSGFVKYWSSTEHNNGGDAYNAIYFSNNTVLQSFDPKSTVCKVRAVRAF